MMKYKQLTIEQRLLVNAAKEARVNAYTPYSNYKVGAAVLTSKGNMYKGCNVESADYTLTTHAEMSAINTMVVNGERIVKSVAVIVDGNLAMPCGLCRQKIYEFADGNVEIIAANLEGLVEITTINKLLPKAFGPKNLGIKTE